MSIQVEFFGIPRKRCGQASFLVETHGPVRLEAVLKILGEQFPLFAMECLGDDGLRAGYVANIGGERFVDDPQTLLQDQVPLLIMSSDAGG